MPSLNRASRTATWIVRWSENGDLCSRGFRSAFDALTFLIETSHGSLSPRVPDDRRPATLFTAADATALIEVADDLLAVALERHRGAPIA